MISADNGYSFVSAPLRILRIGLQTERWIAQGEQFYAKQVILTQKL